MTTKRNPESEQYGKLLKTFYEINCRSKQSQRITKRKKMAELPEKLRVLISEIELRGYKNEGKKSSWKSFFFIISILKSLKQTAIK